MHIIHAWSAGFSPENLHLLLLLLLLFLLFPLLFSLNNLPLLSNLILPASSPHIRGQ